MEGVEEACERVFGLYRELGGQEYSGEKVTQLEHALQCAMRAEESGASEKVILGAFLHDIGHLAPVGDCSAQGEGDMVSEGGIVLGRRNHEHVGEAFLRDAGVPDEICQLARRHVDAKRYLCHKHPDYRKRLSEVSTLTLHQQGGPMTATEASEFESSPYFDTILQLRTWDEEAKVVGLTLQPMSRYEKMLKEVMTSAAKESIY